MAVRVVRGRRGGRESGEGERRDARWREGCRKMRESGRGAGGELARRPRMLLRALRRAGGRDGL
jgi:hypothetical protein